MKNPLQDKYAKAKVGDAAILYITVVASIIALASAVLSSFSFEWVASVNNIADILSCFILIIMALITVYCERIQIHAEDERRKVNIDNSFNKGFAEQPSDEYYTNDHEKAGISRLSLNHFESCFFTHNIASEMVVSARIWTILAIIVIMASMILKDSKLFACICNLGIISLALSEWIRLEVLCLRTKEILARYRCHYSTKIKCDRLSQDSELILLALDYEAALSWSHILLNEKIYERENAKLSREWNEIKTRYYLI